MSGAPAPRRIARIAARINSWPESRTSLDTAKRVLLWSKLARTGSIPAGELPKALKIISDSAAVQSMLVSDLLDAARIASGKMSLVWQEMQLAVATEKAADIVRPSAQAKGVRLELSVDPAAGLVRADPARMQQVVWDLLTRLNLESL